MVGPVAVFPTRWPRRTFEPTEDEVKTMWLVEKVYLVLFVVLSACHELVLAVDALAERLRSKLRARLRVPSAGQILESVGQDLKKNGKLPRHVACLLADGDPEPDVWAVTQLVRWLASSGVTSCSLYDHDGQLARRESLVRQQLEDAADGCKFRVYKGFRDESGHSSNHTFQ